MGNFVLLHLIKGPHHCKRERRISALNGPNQRLDHQDRQQKMAREMVIQRWKQTINWDGTLGVERKSFGVSDGFLPILYEP